MVRNVAFILGVLAGGTIVLAAYRAGPAAYFHSAHLFLSRAGID